uniref:Uncharacterized protein n=1 Tax=Glossina austeni TaxID=7395 RepID=A0A1A9VR62_GLOAU
MFTHSMSLPQVYLPFATNIESWPHFLRRGKTKKDLSAREKKMTNKSKQIPKPELHLPTPKCPPRRKTLSKLRCAKNLFLTVFQKIPPQKLNELKQPLDSGEREEKANLGTRTHAQRVGKNGKEKRKRKPDVDPHSQSLCQKNPRNKKSEIPGNDDDKIEG